MGPHRSENERRSLIGTDDDVWLKGVRYEMVLPSSILTAFAAGWNDEVKQWSRLRQSACLDLSVASYQ